MEFTMSQKFNRYEKVGGHLVKTAVLDIDGVICDFNIAAVRKFGICDESLYSLEARWPGREDEIRKFVSNPLTYLFLEPIDFSWWGVYFLREMGYKIVVVTARPPSWGMRLVTWLWLWFHCFPFDKLIVTDFRSKATLIDSLKPDLAIDDSPVQIAGLMGTCVENVVVFTQPWNEKLEFDGCGRLNGWRALPFLGLPEWQANGKEQRRLAWRDVRYQEDRRNLRL